MSYAKDGDRNPNKYPYGSLEMDHMGMCMFYWSDSPRNKLLTILSLPKTLEWDKEELNILEPILGKYRNEGVVANLDGDLLADINKVIKDQGWEILWWGRFEELIIGEGEFEKDMRSSFREHHDSDSGLSDEPILKKEQKDFIRYLQNYGY